MIKINNPRNNECAYRDPSFSMRTSESISSLQVIRGGSTVDRKITYLSLTFLGRPTALVGEKIIVRQVVTLESDGARGWRLTGVSSESSWEASLSRAGTWRVASDKEMGG